MNEKAKKFSHLAGSVVALVVLVGLTAAAATTISTVITTGGITVGASGTAMTQVLKGTCALLGMDVSQVASSTASYDCNVTGVASGDVVLATAGTTTQATTLWTGGAGWAILSAKASTTADYITFRVANMTGGAAVPSAVGQGKVGSSTNYLIIR